MFANVNVMLPDLGEGTKEATIKSVYVKVGDTVEEVGCLLHLKHLYQYDDLMEVFTDKLVAKIPSTATGVVTAVNYVDDDVAKVGHALITIDEVAEEGAKQAPQEVQAADTPVEAVQQANKVVDKATHSPPGNNSSRNSSAKALSTPAVRHLAKKEGININDVPGTGKAGRVTKTDILNFMNTGSAAPQ